MITDLTICCFAWRRFVSVLILITLLAGCAPAALTPASAPSWPTQGWQHTAPEEQGMDSELLAQMMANIQKDKLNLHSLLIARNGYLVSELYVYPYSAEQAHQVMSVTKSVIATLVGIAIQKGEIKDIHQPLLDLLPGQEAANLDDQKKAITLEDLLTQTSGVDCPDAPGPGEISMEASPDWIQFMLDRPMAAKPGSTFHYCNGATHLLSAVLQQATGMSAREFANRELFGPLGIGPISEERWPSDPQGVTIGGYGLTLTPAEMAKFGYLYLNQGKWDGQTIVPGKWVTAATASHANRGDKKEYGYLWWVDPQKEWYAALGRAGQHVFVYPSKQLVVVFTSDLPYTNDADLAPLQKLLDQYILPAVKSDRSLSPNSKGVAQLEAGIQSLSQPVAMPLQPLPAIASRISGQTYTLEDNPFGWHTLVFTFKEGESKASVVIDGIRQLEFGLDNVYRLSSMDDSSFPEALRGHWEGRDTLVVEDILLGQSFRTISRVQFSGQSLHLDWQELSSGQKIEIQGVLSSAE